MKNYQTQSLAGKSILITGASAGIGAAVATAFGSEDCQLYLVARRKEKLEQLKTSIETDNPNCKVQTLTLDINDPKALMKLDQAGFLKCDVLFNNAGLAKGKDQVGDIKPEDLDLVMQTNLLSAMHLTNAVLPFMKKAGQGDIVNLCSIAAHEAYAGGSVYCASKFALKAFATSLRRETYGQNIRVINVSPGMVETEFSKVRFNDEQKAKEVYQGMSPLTANDIAYQVYTALKTPRHVNIDEIVILATDQGSATTVRRN